MTDTHPDDEGAPPNARRTRPTTEASYGIPDDSAGLLPWSFVTERLAADERYWLSTTRPDGRPGEIARLDDAYDEKYGVRHGTPFFAVRPDAVLVWEAYPTDATRWTFDS